MPIDDHTPTSRGKAALWLGTGLGVLVLVALLTHGFGLLGGEKPPAEEPLATRDGERIVVPERSPLRKRLTVAAAAAEPIVARLVLPGVVEANPARTAAVLTPVGGRVAELKVGLGERVERGQVLAVIDSPDLAQAFGDDDKAADLVRLTGRNLERQEEQFRLGAASSRDLDQARSDATQARAEYARTQARLKVLGVGGEARNAARLLPVTAPVSGSVTTLAIAPGVMVNDPTQPIMTISDLREVWVTALVPEKEVAGIAPHAEATVLLEAYPGRPYRGKVSFVTDVIEPDSHRNKIRIAFPNSDRALKPNMFATVTLEGPSGTHVVLPSSALLMNNDRTSVFVATAPWTFERRTVDVRIEEGTKVAIDGGVAAGEQVVVKGAILLND